MTSAAYEKWREAAHEFESKDAVAELAATIAAVKPIALASIVQTEHEGRPWFFGELIPAGAFLIVGRPKVGKSWLLLQLALCATSCADFLGFHALGKFESLMICAEDDQSRVKSRFEQYRLPAAPAGFHCWTRNEFAELALKYGPHFTIAQFLDMWLAANPLVKFVIIDTESTCRAIWEANRVERDIGITRKDYAETREFDQVAIKHGVFIGLVNHAGKRKGNFFGDPHEQINRTNTALAGASGSMVLSDLPGIDPMDPPPERIFAVRGRDITKDVLLVIKQDEFATWNVVGPWAEHRQTEAEREILEALVEIQDDKGGDGYTSSEDIAAWLGKKAPGVKRCISRMMKAGKKTWNGYRIDTKKGLGIRLTK